MSKSNLVDYEVPESTVPESTPQEAEVPQAEAVEGPCDCVSCAADAAEGKAQADEIAQVYNLLVENFGTELKEAGIDAPVLDKENNPEQQLDGAAGFLFIAIAGGFIRGQDYAEEKMSRAMADVAASILGDPLMGFVLAE